LRTRRLVLRQGRERVADRKKRKQKTEFREFTYRGASYEYARAYKIGNTKAHTRKSETGKRKEEWKRKREERKAKGRH